MLFRSTKKLIEEYVSSVERHGVGCAGHTCGNPRLSKFVVEQGLASGVPVPLLEGFERAMEQATGGDIDAAAQEAVDFAQRNDAQMQARLESIPVPGRDARRIEGYVMEQQDRSQQQPERPAAAVGELEAIWAALPVLAILVAWRWKRRPL